MGFTDNGNAFRDRAQIVFSCRKTIDHVVVLTLQDNYASPMRPTATMPLTLNGITSLNVQTWKGTNRVTLGRVFGNALVMRTVSFPPVTNDRIRINITVALQY